MKIFVKIIRPFVVFSLALVGMNVASPVHATTLCPAGTYVSSYDATICNSTPPGTFTANSGQLNPDVCPMGTYQSKFGQTSCTPTPVGTYTSTTGNSEPVRCLPGTYQPSQNSITCLPSPPGKYVPAGGSTSALDCPTPFGNASSRTAIGSATLMDCYTFSGDQVVRPKASTTYSSEINFDFYLSGGQVAYKEAVINFTNTSTSAVIQVVSPFISSPDYASGNHIGTITVPNVWTNSEFGFRGCVTACPGTAVTTIPDATYNVTFTVREPNSQTTAFSTTINSVTFADTTSLAPTIYVPMQPFISVTDSHLVEFMFPEESLAGSRLVILKNAPNYESATKTHTFTLSNNGRGAVDAHISFLTNAATRAPSEIVAESGDAITEGLWWVSVATSDLRGNPSAVSSWFAPIHIVRDCNPGKFSVNGISSCIDVPRGYVEEYPASASYDSAIKAFSPVKCPTGTYQPTLGGTSCLQAEAGYFVLEPGSSEALPCPLGTFQGDTGQHACYSARAGHFVNQIHSATDLSCLPGTYQPLAGQTSCISADANYFVSTSGAAVQTACPVLTFSLAGASAAGDCKPKPCIVAAGTSATSACMLASVAQVLPAKAKVAIKMGKSFKKICKVSGSKVKALKPGTCTVTLTVKPKKGKSTKHVITVTGT